MERFSVNNYIVHPHTEDSVCADDSGSGDTCSENYALGGTAESSSSYSSYYPAGKAIDGNIGTPWVSKNIYSAYQSEWI